MALFTKEFTLPNAETVVFVFTRISAVMDVYFVSVIDKSKTSYAFQMQSTAKGSWRIADTTRLPDWITAMEKELTKAILAH